MCETFSLIQRRCFYFFLISHSRFCTIFTFGHLLSFFFVQSHRQFTQIDGRKIGSLQRCIETMLCAKASLLLQKCKFLSFHEIKCKCNFNRIFALRIVEINFRYLFVEYRFNAPHWRKCLFFRHFNEMNKFSQYHTISASDTSPIDDYT